MDDPLRLICESDGVFLRREALGAGYDDKTIRSHLRTGAWHRVRHGAYCFAEQWVGATPEQRHLILAQAVLRTTPGPVALSHTTAMIAHGIDTWGLDLSRVHVTRLDSGAGRVERDVVHHVGQCTESDLRLAQGWPATSPARSVIESATILDLEPALCSADSALHKKLCSADELNDVFGSLNHWTGSQKIHVLLHHMDGRAESVGETRSRFLFWRYGLPAPVLQYKVHDRSGQLIGVTDFAWPEHGVLGEFDGRLKYGRLLLPGETPGDAVFREKRREDLLRRITGFVFGRLVWVDLGSPARTAAYFRTLLRIAG